MSAGAKIKACAAALAAFLSMLGAAQAQTKEDLNNQVYSAGWIAGDLQWAESRCTGTISAAHAERLAMDRLRDPATFERAAKDAFSFSVDSASRASHRFSDASASESARLGNLVECQVHEQAYGPNGLLWPNAWVLPEGKAITAK